MEASEMKTKWGALCIADHALAVIAHMAALSVSGVAGMDDSFVRGFSSMFAGSEHTAGVRVALSGEEVSIDLYILAEYGLRIPDLALRLQEKVKTDMESMTGLMVTAVNVYVQGIVFPGDRNKDGRP